MKEGIVYERRGLLLEEEDYQKTERVFRERRKGERKIIAKRSVETRMLDENKNRLKKSTDY